MQSGDIMGWTATTIIIIVAVVFMVYVSRRIYRRHKRSR